MTGMWRSYGEDTATGEGGFAGMVGHLATQDALRKARGEKTLYFHDVKPNYSNQQIKDAVAESQRKSTTTATKQLPKLLPQPAASATKKGAIEETRRRTPATVSKATVSKKKGDAVGRGLMTGVNTETSLLR